MNKINPDAPAMPCDIRREDQIWFSSGISIRAELAARFMAAQLSCDYVGNTGQAPETLAKNAIVHADALIAELNRE